MKYRMIGAALVSLVITLSVPAASPAQESSSEPKYDYNNCRPLTPDEQAIDRENILLQFVAPAFDSTCKKIELIKNLVRKKDDPDKIDANDVFDAAKPNINARTNPYGIPEGLSDEEFKKRLAEAQYRAQNPNWKADQELTRRRQTNAANDDTRSLEQRIADGSVDPIIADDRQLRGDPVVLPPTKPGGSPAVFQPAEPGGPVPTKISEINGEGVLISPDGMKKGPFNQGNLNGYGQEIDPDGTWRGGTFQNGTNMGYVYEVRTVAGKTYIAAGSVVNGKLDGMIERVYADGSTQFEDWEEGQMMQVGARAPKGQAALAPQARYKPVEVAETEDAYKKIGPRVVIAPGTTFDPAASTQAGTKRDSLSNASSSGQEHDWNCGDKGTFRIIIGSTELRVFNIIKSNDWSSFARQGDGSYQSQDRPGLQAYRTIIRLQGVKSMTMAFTNLEGVINSTYSCNRAGNDVDPAQTTHTSFDGKWENTEPHYPNSSPAYAVRQITVVTRPEGLFVTTEGGDFSGLFVLTNVFEGGKKYRHDFAAPSGGYTMTHYIEAYDGYTVFRVQDGSYGANFRRWRTPAQHATDRGRAEQIWKACQGKARALVTFRPMAGATEAMFQTQIEEEHQKVLNAYDRRLNMSEMQTNLQGLQAQYPAKQARFQSYPQDFSAGRDFLLYDQWLCYAQQEMALTR